MEIISLIVVRDVEAEIGDAVISYVDVEENPPESRMLQHEEL